MNQDLARLQKKVMGDGPIEKHIILLKMVECLNTDIEFGDKPILEANTPQRKWLSEAGALLRRLGIQEQVEFKAAMSTAASYWKPTINSIQGQLSDAIEAIKLELELDGRTEIGSVYHLGDVYKFFADLKDIIKSAQSRITIIDPYFDGSAFNDYLGAVSNNVAVKILASKYIDEVKNYAEKHKSQFGSDIELRKSKELHDRIIIIDSNECWIVGGSIKDAGKKATYLIPLSPSLAEQKVLIYNDIWNNSSEEI